MTTRPPRRRRPGVTLFLTVSAAAAVLASGCTRSQPPLAKTAPTLVTTTSPEVRDDAVEYEDFTGRTEAVEFVEIRPHVTGYVQKINFEDGDLVEKGRVLFEIDSETYQRELDRATAAVNAAQVHLDRVTRDYKRVEPLKDSSISHEEWDRVVGDYNEAKAALGVAEKARALAETNLKYTKVVAPFSGRLSRRMVHRGALAKADETILTVLVTVDPIYVNFDVDDRTILRIRKDVEKGLVSRDWLLLIEGKLPPDGKTHIQVQVGLPDDEGFPYTGTVNFFNSYIEPGTGTLRVRATLEGEKLRIPPGLFVRVRLPVGLPRRVVLVPEEAIGTDQDKKFVYVVHQEKNEDGSTTHRAEYRQVKLGQQYGSKRVVETGVAATDKVIVSGLQRVRDRSEVNPKEVPTPPAVLSPVPSPPNRPTAGGASLEKPAAPVSRPAGG